MIRIGHFERFASPVRLALRRHHLGRYALAGLTKWRNIVPRWRSVAWSVAPLGALCLSLICSGCGKKAAAERPVPSANLLMADGQVDLQAFTLLLHRYVERVNKVPSDLNELVTSGFVPSLPAPPAGRRWAIERGAMDYRVIVVDK